MVLSAIGQTARVLSAIGQTDRVLPAIERTERVLPTFRQVGRVLPAIEQTNKVLSAIGQTNGVIQGFGQTERVLSAIKQTARVLSAIRQTDGVLRLNLILRLRGERRHWHLARRRSWCRVVATCARRSLAATPGHRQSAMLSGITTTTRHWSGVTIADDPPLVPHEVPGAATVRLLGRRHESGRVHDAADSGSVSISRRCYRGVRSRRHRRLRC